MISSIGALISMYGSSKGSKSSSGIGWNPKKSQDNKSSDEHKTEFNDKLDKICTELSSKGISSAVNLHYCNVYKLLSPEPVVEIIYDYQI